MDWRSYAGTRIDPLPPEATMQIRFDTIADHVATRPADPLDAELEAFNAAFEELDLAWRWDRAVLAELGTGDDRARVGAFLHERCPHLLKVYDAAFLVELIVSTKARWGKQVQ
jgi:hypothetical protein